MTKVVCAFRVDKECQRFNGMGQYCTVCPMVHVERRKWLTSRLVICACGESNQVQLVEWLTAPAQWRCRRCGRDWTWEPLKPAQPKGVLADIKRLRIAARRVWVSFDALPEVAWMRAQLQRLRKPKPEHPAIKLFRIDVVTARMGDMWSYAPDLVVEAFGSEAAAATWFAQYGCSLNGPNSAQLYTVHKHRT